ncbi:MAG: hypothetical protein IAE99_09145 [Rhodothermales bacterium]|nr:hypothetical protein [Rhodothermales bacterium]
MSAPATIKQRVARAVEGMPDDVSYEDIIERIVFLRKIEQGLKESQAGQVVPQAEIEAEARAWRS